MPPRAPCELFVPKVRGSKCCSICDRDESEHTTASPYSVPSIHSSQSTSPMVAPSENSAFSIYRKVPSHAAVSPDAIVSRRPLHRRAAPPQTRILTPRVRRAQLHLDNRSDANLAARIEDEKKRSSSAGNRLDDDTTSSTSDSSRSPSPVKEERVERDPRRARNFHKILNRFQARSNGSTTSANEAATNGRPNRRITVGNVKMEPSPSSPSISRRSSLHGNSPSRTNSARSQARGRAVPSPISHYLPESSVRPSLTSHRSPLQSDSPFSLESLPPIKPIPLSISIPNGSQNKRRSLPAHWVKETDIDDPTSFEFPPISSPEDTRDSITFMKSTPMVGAVRETFEKKPMMTGNCRRLTDLHQNNIQNGRRSKSREEHLNDINGIDSIRHEGSLISRSSFSLSPGVTLSRARAVENSYSQMCSGTVSTLSWVGEKLSERSRKEEMIMRGPFSAFTFHHLLMQRNPVLIKGSSFFFDASFMKDRKEHDVTVMISPHSHYAPVIRRGLGVSTYGEIEDIDGSIAKFLRDHMEEEPPALKAVIMPRMKLCSLHALAAQNLHRTMDAEQFEAHIAFVLIRLLSALKLLQTDGIESLSTNFREFLLVYRTWNKSNDVPQLLFLPDALESVEESDSEQVGLCRYALRALCTLLHHRIDGEVPRILDQTRHSRALLAAAKSLHSDKSNSLSMSKQLLELSLWGQGTTVEGDFEAKLWMDARRAECVNQLLRALIEESSGWEEREKLRVEFLLSTTPRSLSLAHSTLATTHFEQ